jgi:hypothetical protein
MNVSRHPWIIPALLLSLTLALTLRCTPQQAQQAQQAVTIACAVESQAVPVAIVIDAKPEDQGNIAKADLAAKAACAAMNGLVVKPAS